ncbi:MAG: DUF169 domain-containing protein [Desulfobacca sp.]|uniref:DUF169 domain-containing protein n=1 Tax=Desulfobacca sp. TaxID=2067990 RepID=UPI00404B066E
MNYPEIAEFISNNLRLRTLPVAVHFLRDKAAFPAKTRQPSVVLQKRITICMGVTMARVYGWTVGLTREDLICVPAMIMFGFTEAEDQTATLARLFADVNFAGNAEKALQEAGSMTRLAKGEYEALLLLPLAKATAPPDTVLCYGNPAQIMRLAQAYTYLTGHRVAGHCGGKVECDEYLIAPFKSGQPRLAIPGMGDRIFSMTQDDELVFALPGAALAGLVQGLKESGKKIGARYPITFYQNFQPEFPKIYQDLGKEIGVA